MSRSRRKTPIVGYTTARSEADDKRLWHKRWRARERDQLAGLGPESDPMPVHRQDGVQYLGYGEGWQTLVCPTPPAGTGGTHRGPAQQVETGTQGAAGETFGQMAREVGHEEMGKAVIGNWRITGMDAWDADYFDMEMPAHITIRKDLTSEFQFGLMQAQLDGKIESANASSRLAFSWSGFDENDPVNGRGWLTAAGDKAEGRIFIHLGDESGFKVERAG